VDGVWLARYPHLRRRSSSADIRDNVSSRTQPHARSQVLAAHRGLMYRISLMYRIIGHYPVISPTVVVIGNQSAVNGRCLGAPPGHGGFEVGGGDEGADFGVQAKAELDLHLIGGLGHPQSRVMIAWAGVRRCTASSKVCLARSVTWPPQRSRVTGPVTLAGSCTSRRIVSPSSGPTSTNCLIPSPASSSRLTVHVSMASARLASSPRRGVSAAGRLATLARDHRSEKAVQGRMGPTAPNLDS
jgi:hypothetical protein